MIMPRSTAKPKTVAGTADTALYDSYRSGNFAYDIPLPDGAWTLVLHSFEPSVPLAASRRFTVKADGRPVLQDYSPAAQAGGVLKAAEQAIPIEVRGGHLHLDFVSSGGNAIVSAIEIRPRNQAPDRPI